MKIEFSNGNILIRPYRAEDAGSLYEAVRESMTELSVWMPWCHPNYSIEESTAWVMSREDAWQKEMDYGFVITDAMTGDYLGGTGLNKIDHLNRSANLGYWVRSSRAGRGVASGAARLVARFGFEELGLHRLEIVAAVGNIASQRAAEKAGAVREGVMRKCLLLHNQSHDAVLYSLVAEDMLACVTA